ncbi:MAG: threonine--tRNA ligase [Candidatus Nanoarchaeia archaeon]|nr:threonine--tRNA ligase [Candidatus Nanoarchaeia archaeon]MDD5588423.1 threonine--tRNA ligase [Candidatus Nanoarchaeia archaeon]
MKFLSLHCDYIKFKALKKAINSIELKEEDKKLKEIKETLVILTAVEKEDSIALVEDYVKNIEDIAKQVKTNCIVLYPYAHLSSQLASPDIAVKVLEKAEEILKKDKFKVVRAPFGVYKEFELKCKGHPLSELSRELKMGDIPKGKTQREEIVEKIDRKYYFLTPQGKEYKVDVENLEEIKKVLGEIKNEDLSTYILFNEIKHVTGKEPPSIKEMQQQELVGYAPEADVGHFKFYPKGNLIFELLKEWAYEIAVNRLHSLQIETPVIYDWADPEIREQGGSFHERHYVVKATDDPKKEWVLRFAGDFGLFKIMKKANISYNNLPIRMYEFSKSFRYEQKGELSGLRRLRAFHMPDIHSFTSDLNSGWAEYKELYKNYDDLAKGTGIKYAIVFRVVEDFYKKYKDQIIEMLKYSKAPAFIETLSGMKHYWAVKHEFQGLDSVNGSTQLSTVQLDVKDAETYGIVYTDKDNKKKGCTIVHSSVGSIERWFFCILEKAFLDKSYMWPYWLSPTQLRIATVADRFNKDAEKSAEDFNKLGIRTDIDDRSITLPKKISESEREWIPYTIVIGEKEISSGKLALRIRGNKEIENLTKEELIKKLKSQQGNMPWKPLPLNILLSKRPIFYG